MNGDIWGIAYKLVTRKIGALWESFILNTDQMNRIAWEFLNRLMVVEHKQDFLHFTMRRVEEVVLTMTNKHVLGVHGIP